MLATLLNSTDIQFSLPGSHGRIFPWALPRIGISYEIACSLEDELQKQLLLAIQRRVDKLIMIPESQTNSPAASDEVIEAVEGNWEELLMNTGLVGI
jgi:hypothetical protein